MSGKNPPSAALETLGCKVNQYESSFFLEELGRAGYEIVSFRERADVYIVHGCAVTSRAAYQVRQLLRRAGRLNPNAKIIATGCSVQVEADRLAAEGIATHVIGNIEKFDLINWLNEPGSLDSPACAVGDPRGCGRFHPAPVSGMLSDRARAFLKIQDGCDSFCTYCIVPFTRGKSRSLELDGVLEQMGRFIGNGYREVVLSGIHLGQWGKDLQPRTDLMGLLNGLRESGKVPGRLRLSSLETMEWTGGLVNLLKGLDWICPHFHVPLQSGDEGILKRMGRPYTPARYAEVIRELRAAFPNAAIGADVIAGFPGESDTQFENTVRLISELPVDYLHVFPFSPRPGTAAAEWKGRATGAELKRRTRELQSLGTRKRQEFQNSFIGQTVEVLVETQADPGWWQGTSGNYLHVLFPSEAALSPGSFAMVRLESFQKGRLTGRMVSTPC